MFKQVIREIAHSAVGDGIWNFLKSFLWPLVSASVIAAGFTFWSWFSSLPGPVIGLIALSSFCLVFIFARYVLSAVPEVPETFVEFFSNHTALESKLPFRDIFREGNEIHAFFLSGQGVFSGDQGRFKYVRRLLLPKPESKYLTQLQTFSVNEYFDAPEQIRITTRAARERKVQVKWFDDFIGMSLLFCNPEEPAGWVQIELSPPFVEREYKQSIRIQKTQNPETFKMLYLAFQRMWEHSNNPKEEGGSRPQTDLTFRNNAYWKTNGEGPFCPKCHPNVVPMMSSGGQYSECPKCNTSTNTSGRPIEQPKVITEFNLFKR